MGVVDLFEMVDIEECDDGAASDPAQSRQFAVQCGHEIATVEQTRQEISIGLPAHFQLIHDKLSKF